jgi:uncharacterized MAPEG superfamily protein
MDAMTTMPTEIVLLGWSVVLLLVQLALQATMGVVEHGPPYAFSPRDEGREVKNLVGARLGRAYYNLLETYPVFVALALALAVTDQTGGLGATGAQIWFWARIVYVPLYAFGIPYIRTLVWTVSAIGLVMMLIALL